MSKRGEQAMVPDATPQSYYGRPVVKEPVWRWPVPAYFFSGGLAAGSSLLAAGARATGNATLARRSSITALAGIGASTYFLIEDLGRPERFVNMLRVMKPTSPMSMGSWLLAAYGPATGLAALSEVTGVLPAVGRAAEGVAAALAPAVATYTAVVIADTAVPAWHEARRSLPFLFASGAAASAGALACIVNPQATAGPARRLLYAGAAGEVVASAVMKRDLGDLADVYREGVPRTLTKVSTACTAAGAAVIARFGRRRRAAAVAGGSLVLAGALLERLAVFEAGRASARDPKYTVAPQRRRARLSP